MNLITDLVVNGKYEMLCESSDDYGAGGGFPSLAGHIESEAAVNLATHLHPECEDGTEALKRHPVSAVCAKAREIEAAGEIVNDGIYEVTATTDGKSYTLNVRLAW